MIFPKLCFFMSFSIFAAGCGPGISDYGEKIKGTELIYIDSNSLNRIIAKLNPNGEQENLIGPSILSYRIEGDYIFGVRQVVNHYICNQTRSDVEVTDQIEFFAINTSSEEAQYSSSSFGEFSEFESYLEANKVGAQVVRAFRPDVFKDKLIAANTLGECESPKLIVN